MKTFDFANEASCSLINEISKSLKEKYFMVIPNNLIGNLYRVIFRSFALMCKYHASKKDHKVGFSFKDQSGNFVIGTILTFQAPESEDSDDNGNWNLSMTFNQDDMENCDVYLDTYNDSYLAIVQSELFADINAHCDSNSDLITIITEFVNHIKIFLDINSNDSDEEVCLTMKSVFDASVSFENGTKVFSIVPGYAIKQIVKNDDETEKKD